MKVLIACEESHAVCKEFRKLGHEAYSCNIDDCSGEYPEWHIKDDAVEVAYREHWNLMIAHPPYTRLTNTDVRWLKEPQADKTPLGIAKAMAEQWGCL